MSVNWDAVHKLLSISDLAHKWPMLRALSDAALRELIVHSDVAKKYNDDVAKELAAQRTKEAHKVEVERIEEEETETKVEDQSVSNARRV